MVVANAKSAQRDGRIAWMSRPAVCGGVYATLTPFARCSTTHGARRATGCSASAIWAVSGPSVTLSGPCSSAAGWSASPETTTWRSGDGTPTADAAIDRRDFAGRALVNGGFADALNAGTEISAGNLVVADHVPLAEAKRLITQRFLELRLAGGTLPQPFQCAI